MNEENEKVMNEILDSIYDCVDHLNLLTDQRDLNQNISKYLASLRILKRELNTNIQRIQGILSQ